MTSIARDVLVIGGGPAGSSTAIFLARFGYQVTLVERSTFPRVKPCGDYLTPGAVRLLRDDLGVLPNLLERGAVLVSRESVVTHDRTRFSGTTNALACPRAVTDDALLNCARGAGVEVLEDFHVRHIETSDNDAVTGITGIDSMGARRCYRARITIGADGAHSLLARKMDVVRPIKRLQRLAIVASYAQMGTAAATDENQSVIMHLPSDRSDACCGVGPLCGPGNGARNVNIVVPAIEAARIAGRKHAYFAERLRISFPEVWMNVSASAQLRDLRTIGCFGHDSRHAAHPGAAIVGDAATFIHPFTGEGVYFSIRGAQLLAVAIHEVLRKRSVSHLHVVNYDAARHRELRPRYQLCDLIQRIVHSPRALGLAARRMRRSEALTDIVLQTIGDVAAPRDLLQPWVLREALMAF